MDVEAYFRDIDQRIAQVNIATRKECTCVQQARDDLRCLQEALPALPVMCEKPHAALSHALQTSRDLHASLRKTFARQKRAKAKVRRAVRALSLLLACVTGCRAGQAFLARCAWKTLAFLTSWGAFPASFCRRFANACISAAATFVDTLRRRE